MADNPTPDSNEPPRAASPNRDAPAPGWEREALERIALAAITEQRAARRWRIFFRFAFLAVFAVIAWAILDISGARVESEGRHTALVSLDGEIGSDTPANAEDIISALDSAFDDDGTAGVILHVDSPGGSPVQAGMINDEIHRLRTKYPAIPLYVVVGDMCASGGYYVAAAADKIYVNKASIVGSIGVLMDGFGFTGLMDKVGVERRLLTAGENKGFLDPFSPMSDAQRAHAQQMLDEIHRQFIDVVKSGRGDRLKVNSPGLFSGLFWSGQQAVELGLADQLGNIDYVAREVIKAEEVIDYTRRENVAEKLAKKFGSALGDASVRAMRSMPALR